MKKEDLFEAIGKIDDCLLEQSEQKNNKSKIYWTIGTGIIVAASVMFLFAPMKQPPVQDPGNEVIVNPQPDEPVIDEPDYDDLPKLEISFETGGMGFEGYLVKDISDLRDVNGWNESVVYNTLPVYRNKLKNAEAEDVKEIAFDIAQKLQMKVDENDIVMEYDEMFDIHYATIEDENYRIRTSSEDLCTTIDILNPIPLPDHINNTHDATFEEKQVATEYMLNEWKDVIALNDPHILITGGDYNIYERQLFNSLVVEGESDLFDFFKKQAAIYDNSENSMWLLRIWEEKEYELIADYPIISVEEAKQMLLEGKYVSSAPAPEPLTEENILKVDMLYRGSRYSDVVLPYYRFYMKTEGYWQDMDGYFTAGAYYVPAIEERFIANEDLWNGQFN